MNTKTCTKCKQTYPATTEFFYYKQYKVKDKLNASCVFCERKYAKQIRIKNKHKQPLIRIQNKIYRQKRLERGLCDQCIQPRLPDDKRRCKKHWLMQRSLARLGTTKRWKELENILIKQNYKCAYTGEPLILGLNASIDHIKPIFKYPELQYDINNIQWVTKKLMILKENIPMRNF